MKTSVASLAIALLATGCGSGFSQLGSFTLQFHSLMTEIADSEFHYDPTRGCRQLDADFSVTVNGEPAFTQRGGTYVTSDTRAHCLRPGFVFNRPRPILQTATVEASCGEDRQLVEIEGLGSNLEGEPLLTPGEAAHPGGSLQIALEPGFDRLEWPGAGSLVSEPDPSRANVPTTVFFAPPSQDGILKVTLPVTLPPGPTHLLIELSATPRITRCEGLGACAWNPLEDKAPVRLDVAFDVAP